MKLIVLLTLCLVTSSLFASTTKIAKTSAKETVQVVRTQAAATSSGNSYTHELFTNVTTGSLKIETSCKLCSSQTTINLNASYLHFVQDKVQAGAEAGINYTSSGNSTTLLSLVGVGTYNFESEFSNTFFVKAGLGIYTLPVGSNTETKLGLFVGAGKRFAWLTNINYAPEVRLVKKGNLDIGLEATLLNFAIHWN